MIRSIDTACYMDKKKGKMGSRVKKKDIHQKHQFYFNENIVILVFASGSIPFLVIRCVKVSTKLWGQGTNYLSGFLETIAIEATPILFHSLVLRFIYSGFGRKSSIYCL